MTRQLTSPTCPITTWFRLRRTFWTEPLHQAFSASVPDCMSSCRPLCGPKGQSCCSAWASQGPEVHQALDVLKVEAQGALDVPRLSPG